MALKWRILLRLCEATGAFPLQSLLTSPGCAKSPHHQAESHPRNLLILFMPFQKERMRWMVLAGCNACLVNSRAAPRWVSSRLPWTITAQLRRSLHKNVVKVHRERDPRQRSPCRRARMWLHASARCAQRSQWPKHADSPAPAPSCVTP